MKRLNKLPLSLEGIHFLIDLKALKEQKESEQRWFGSKANKWAVFFYGVIAQVFSSLLDIQVFQVQYSIE